MSKMKPTKAQMYTIKKILLDHTGAENTISRKSLFAQANHSLGVRGETLLVNDRDMRNAIYHLRCSTLGFDICHVFPSKNNPGGYFKARNLAELEAHLKSDINRAISTNQRINAQLRHAKSDISPQLKLDLPLGTGGQNAI